MAADDGFDVVVSSRVEDSDLNALDFLMLVGFILTVIVVAIILRLVLQLTRARMLVDLEEGDLQQQHHSSQSQSLLSLVFLGRR